MSGRFTIDIEGHLCDFYIDLTHSQIEDLANEVLKEHCEMLEMYDAIGTNDEENLRYLSTNGTPYLFDSNTETCGIIDIENYNAVVIFGCPEILKKICIKIKLDFHNLFLMIQKDLKEAYKSGESLAKSFDEPFDNLEEIFLASSILEIKHLPHEIFVHASEKIKNGWNKNLI